MGLVLILLVLFYFAVVIVATVIGYRWGEKRGWSRTKRWSGAATGFLLLLLPMVWDWVPTIWLHSYYCHKHGGLAVYKTPDQWRESNPEVAKTLIRQRPPSQVGAWPKFSTQLNQRFRSEFEAVERSLWLRETRQRIVDVGTGEVLVQFVDVSTGQPGSRIERFRDIKVWMRQESCEPEGHIGERRFNGLLQEFENLGASK